MADSTSGARQVAQDTDMETIIQKTAAPPAASEAAREAPVGPMEAVEAAPAPPVLSLIHI